MIGFRLVCWAFVFLFSAISVGYINETMKYEITAFITIISNGQFFLFLIRFRLGSAGIVDNLAKESTKTDGSDT